MESRVAICEMHKQRKIELSLYIYHNYLKIKSKEADTMNMIRPVSDLRNNFADISKVVHETAQPVFLSDMAVLSMEAFANELLPVK